MIFSKKYLNPQNYALRLLAEANLHLLGHLEKVIAPNIDIPLRHPPIFFLGAPRSGSTLMIQVITDALDLGYISNRHCQFFGAPVVAEYLFHPLRNKPLSDYQSNHGTTHGAHAPAECGEWWYRFFRRKPAYVTLSDVDPIKMQAFRCSIAALTNAMDKPILFKNLYASLRLEAIAKFIPESLFIVTHRREVDNAHSLLEARYKHFNDYKPWFSIEPPAIEKLKELPAHEQVIEQIRHIHSTINQDMQAAGVTCDRRFDLNYEEFCSNPSKSIDAIQAFLKSHACQTTRCDISIPDHFSQRNIIRIDQELYQAMLKYSSETY